MSLLMPYTSAHAIVCPLVHTSVLPYTVAPPDALLGAANTIFYYWDYYTIRNACGVQQVTPEHSAQDKVAKRAFSLRAGGCYPPFLLYH